VRALLINSLSKNQVGPRLKNPATSTKRMMSPEGGHTGRLSGVGGHEQLIEGDGGKAGADRESVASSDQSEPLRRAHAASVPIPKFA
jgi:hypothetical protein